MTNFCEYFLLSLFTKHLNSLRGEDFSHFLDNEAVNDAQKIV